MKATAAVHLHSEWSFDGHWTLETMVRRLRRLGYDAMLTAEHSQSMDADRWSAYRAECDRLTTPDFVVVPGIEYRDADNVVHLPTWGDLPFFGDALDIGRLLEDVDRLGGASVLAHPGRKDAWRRVDPSWGRWLSGVEVWNRKYDGWLPSEPGRALRASLGLPGYASLDLHAARQVHPLATVVTVRSGVDEAAVVQALRTGSVQPTFFGCPVQVWESGLPARALSAADTGRRTGLRWARRLRP